LFRKAKIRHGLTPEIRDIKICVEEVAKRHGRYTINNDVSMPVMIDPRLFAQYTEVKELVGIDEARDELIKTLEEENGVSMQQNGKIVSFVGFGDWERQLLQMQFKKRLEHNLIVVLLFQCLKLLT